MKLILLNGPTGVGKSTIATHLHKGISQSILLDVDELRRTIPNYRERRKESLTQAYELTIAAIERAFNEGKNVIIDKTIGDTEVLDKLVSTADKYNADVYEFLLFADKETVRRRADERGYKTGGLLTPEKVEEHWERANKLKKERPNIIVIETNNLTPEEVLIEIRKELKLV